MDCTIVKGACVSTFPAVQFDRRMGGTRIQVFSTSYPHRHGAMYCVFQLRAFPSYGHCLNLHCPDKGGLTVSPSRFSTIYTCLPFALENLHQSVCSYLTSEGVPCVSLLKYKGEGECQDCGLPTGSQTFLELWFMPLQWHKFCSHYYPWVYFPRKFSIIIISHVPCAYMFKGCRKSKESRQNNTKDN